MTQFTHITGQPIRVNDAVLYVEEIPNPQKPYLLLLHGGLGHMEEFNPVLPYLTGRFHLIGMDSRGQGKSTLGSQKLTYERLQQDVEAVLQRLSIDTVHILGVSDGGIVGYRLAASGLIHVEKLITIGASWQVDDIETIREPLSGITSDSFHAEFPETYADYQRLNPNVDFTLLTTAINGLWFDDTPTGYPGECVRQIRCPTLLVRGDDDELFSRKSITQLADILPNARLFNLPFAGHLAYLDQPELFRVVVEQFLDS